MQKIRVGRRKTGVSRHRSSTSVADIGAGLRSHAVKAVLAVVLLMAGLAGYQCITWLQRIEVGSIEFYGYSGSAESNRGIAHNELQRLVAPYMQQKFWQLDLLQIQAQLEQHPWVRSATVRREWPDHLQIGIDEHVPIARWNSRHLLTATGSLIEDADALLISSLPRFSVPVAAVVSAEKARAMVARYNSLQKQLAQYGQQIIEVGIAGASRVTVKLASGATIKLGDSQHLKRLDRLVNLVETELLGDWRKIATADLRYSAGIAVRWVDADFDDEIESLLPIAQSPLVTPGAEIASLKELVIQDKASTEV